MDPNTLTTDDLELAAYAAELRREELLARGRKGDHEAGKLAEKYITLTAKLWRLYEINLTEAAAVAA